MSKTTAAHTPYQPWLNSYPDGIDYAAPIDTTPVPERIAQSVKTHAERVALDFLGKETTYAELGEEIDALAGALQKQMGIKKKAIGLPC